MLAAITLVLIHTTAQAWLRKAHVDTGQVPTAK
jgi:hypothetical protein